MIPAGIETLGATVHYQLREAVEGADAVMMLRIQHERIGDPLIPGTREYSKLWGLNAKKAAEWLRPSCVILHPGPINRGVELSPEVADGPQQRHPGPGAERGGGADGDPVPARRRQPRRSGRGEGVTRAARAGAAKRGRHG